MSVILDFFVNNYLVFLIMSFILVFALIGYFVDTKKDARFSEKIELDKELRTKLDAAEAANMTLNQMMTQPLSSAPTATAPAADAAPTADPNTATK